MTEKYAVVNVKSLLLRAICAAYLIAFLSFYHQSLGLIGENGISPAITIHSVFPITSDTILDILSLTGATISLIGFVRRDVNRLPILIALWLLYSSLTALIGPFHNQFDHLLLESGFICVLLAATKSNGMSDRIGIFLMKWLLFRFLFESGSVKIISRCPKWWTMTAFGYHFETMPLPTRLGYYSHYSPKSCQMLTSIFVNLVELVFSWIIFVPSAKLRLAVFHLQIFLQMCIIFTGIYGPLPLLVSIISLSLLTDVRLTDLKCVSIVLRTFACTLAIVLFISCFQPQINEPTVEILLNSVRVTPFIAIAALNLIFAEEMNDFDFSSEANGFIQRMPSIAKHIGVVTIGIAMVGLSMVPHGNLDVSTNLSESRLSNIYHTIEPYRIVNQYGLHLQQMRAERYEIVFQHSQNRNGPWSDYNFIYKPWNSSSLPTGLSLHLPRLDFAFYEIATDEYLRNEPWPLSFAGRLLQNEQSILKLFGVTATAATKPKYVRAMRYLFKFAPLNASRNEWWIKSDPIEYLEALSLNESRIDLHQTRISRDSVQKLPHTILLDFVRCGLTWIDADALICTILVIAFSIIIYQKRTK